MAHAHGDNVDRAHIRGRGIAVIVVYMVERPRRYIISGVVGDNLIGLRPVSSAVRPAAGKIC